MVDTRPLMKSEAVAQYKEGTNSFTGNPGLLSTASTSVRGRKNPAKPAPRPQAGMDPNRHLQYLARIKGQVNYKKPKTSSKGPYANTINVYSRNYAQEQGAVKKLYASPAAPGKNTNDQQQGKAGPSAANLWLRSMVYGRKQ